MNSRRVVLWSALVLAAIGALALLAIAMPRAAAAPPYVNYTDNEDSAHARWLEEPMSIGPVLIWDRTGSINQDWWRFNATGGQLVEIKFRKYTQEPNIGLPGYSYYIIYDVWGPWVAGTSVYKYTSTQAQWGQPTTDRHRRDSFSFVVPETVTGNANFFIRVHAVPPQYQHVNYAFYWLNVTVSDRISLDTQRTYSGAMEMRSNQSADYNFIDTFLINLTSSNTTGDLVRAHLHKDMSDHHVYLDAWELLVFGGTRESFEVNRSYTNTGDVDLFFTADHTGQYQIDVFRDFWNAGLTNYTLDVTVTRHALDGNDAYANATYVPKAKTLFRQPIEMGFDTHDWYAVQLLAGDSLFKVTVTLNDPTIDGHAYQMTVYDQSGRALWTVNNWQVQGQNIVYDSKMVLPPEGTPTIFDTDQLFYVRVSVDPANCAATVKGFAATYDITFALTNRAPVLVTPFAPLYTWNEDETLSIELTSHFFDADGDAMEYVIYNKTAGFTYDIPALTFTGWLNITPPQDWNGEVHWRLRASDHNPPDARHYIYVDLDLRVLPVNDQPHTNGTLRVGCTEDGYATASLKRLFHDVDTGEMGNLTYGYEPTALLPIVVTFDRRTGDVTLRPGPDVFGTFNLTFNCTDGLSAPVKGTIELTVAGVNDIPRIKASLPTIDMREGDPPRELDLAPYFYDVDGDALLYVLKVPKEVNDRLSVSYRNNDATQSIIVIELTDPHYYGTVVVNVSAKDTSQTQVSQNLTIRVANVPNPPTIEYIPLGNPAAINEGQNFEFKVTDVFDPDPTEMGLHTFTWYVDNVTVPEHNSSNFIYQTGYADAGTHTIKVEVTDPQGLMATPVPEWSITVRDVNRAPAAKIQPIGPLHLTDKDLVDLSVNATDPDGDTLSVTWWLVKEEKDVQLGKGSTIHVKLPAGTDTIGVEVNDGKGGIANDTFRVSISKSKSTVAVGGALFIGIIVVVVLVVVVAVAIVAMRGRKKKAAVIEAKMDLDSLEQIKPTPKDYGDYEEIHQ